MDPIATEILTAAGGAIAAKIFDGPFKTLEDFWFSHFGYKAAECRIQKEAEYLDYSIYENNSFYYSCQQEVFNNQELYSKLALKKYFSNMTAFGRTFKASCF